MPCSCALFGEFAIGARVPLLWQHTRLMRNVSEDVSILAVWLVHYSHAAVEKIFTKIARRAVPEFLVWR